MQFYLHERVYNCLFEAVQSQKIKSLSISRRVYNVLANLYIWLLGNRGFLQSPDTEEFDINLLVSHVLCRDQNLPPSHSGMSDHRKNITASFLFYCRKQVNGLVSAILLWTPPSAHTASCSMTLSN